MDFCQYRRKMYLLWGSPNFHQLNHKHSSFGKGRGGKNPQRLSLAI